MRFRLPFIAVRPALLSLSVLLLAAAVACGSSPGTVAPPATPAQPATDPAPAPTAAPAWDPADPVRLGTSADYPPFNFINERGEIDGFERALGDELCRRAELRCEWVQNDWVTIIPHLTAGNYDAIIAGMAATKERAQLVDFTQAYLPSTPSAYVALAGAGDDAINGRVAVQVNTIQHDYLVESGVTRVVSLPAGDPVQAVQNGDADAVFADKPFLKGIVADSGGTLVFVGPEITLESSNASIAVRPIDSRLRDRLNAAISKMKEDGALNDLIRQWFGEDAGVF